MKLNLINPNADDRIDLRHVTLATQENFNRGPADPQGIFRPAPMTSACARRILKSWVVPLHSNGSATRTAASLGRYTGAGFSTTSPVGHAGCTRLCERWFQIAVPAVVVWAALPGLGFGPVVLGGIACGVLLAALYSDDAETVKIMLHERYEREHADRIARYIQTYIETLRRRSRP